MSRTACPQCGKPKVATYARISDDQKGERLGVTDQIEDCWARAGDEGWCVCDPEADTYVDNDIGAYRKKKRPGYEALLEGLAAGKYGVLVARDDSRLTRNVRDAHTLVELVETQKLRVVTLWTEHWDLTTAAGRKRVRDSFSDAQYEAERTGERVARARLRDARKGKPSPGSKAWGFKTDRMTHEPAEVEAIRDVARRLLAGESLRSASLRYGKNPKDVKRALRAKRMIGVREHKGQEYPAAWEPILDVDTFEALRVLLTDPSRDQVAKVAARKYLLTGFIFCGVCGSRCHGYKVSGARNKDKIRIKYACWPRGHVTRMVYLLDGYVRDQLLARAEVSIAPAEIDPALSGAVVGYRSRLTEAKELWKSGAMTAEEYASDKADLETRLTDAEERLRVAEAVALGPAAKTHLAPAEHGFARMFVGEQAERYAWWEAADLRQRRVLLAKHVSRIEILPNPGAGKLFDPTAIAIYGLDGERWEHIEITRAFADEDIAAEVAARYAETGFPEAD